LTGVTWILEAGSAEALIGEVVPDTAVVSARFGDDGTVSGSAGCNSFSGSYSVADDGGISIDPGAMTQMACDEPLMQLEAEYMAALDEARSFEVIDEGGGLLLSGGRTPLSYVAEQQLPLEGTAWTVDGIALGNDAVSSAIAGSEADLRFDAGSVSGSTGCNRLTGSYALDAAEGSISFSEIATTMKLCEPEVATQEQAILASLDEATSYSIEGSTMTLAADGGSFLLSLTGS
jgi:heat shock protein HslJ